MRDPKRIDVVLSDLKEYWEKYPDLRLCQIIAIATYDLTNREDPFHIEDEALVDWIKRQK
jgi:uncharacterized protein YihD (DUF1040 family)